MTLRVLIVDDEPPARVRLRTMLEMLPDADDLELLRDAEDGVSAVERITEERPDAVFLDVQMPALDGFGVVRALVTDAAEHGHPLPIIVFATAFEEHAIRAFEASAVDYLLKPFNGKRLAQAVDRIRERCREREALQRAESAPAELPADIATLLAALPTRAAKPLERIAVRVGERVYWVRTEELNWVTADGNYLRLRTGAGTAQSREHLIRRPLSVFADELDPRRFARIHRSVLVNIDRIKELRAIADGEYHVIMDEGTRFKLSRSFRHNLPDF